jgi:hypothetical protein
MGASQGASAGGATSGSRRERTQLQTSGPGVSARGGVYACRRAPDLTTMTAQGTGFRRIHV